MFTCGDDFKEIFLIAAFRNIQYEFSRITSPEENHQIFTALTKRSLSEKSL